MKLEHTTTHQGDFFEITDTHGATISLDPNDALLVGDWINSRRGELTRLVNGLDTDDRDPDEQITFVRGCSVSSEAQMTGNAWASGHDDDTGEYITAMNSNAKRTMQGKNTRYEFPDGTVLIQHDEFLETEQEMKEAEEEARQLRIANGMEQ